MFYGLTDPYARIREEATKVLRQQVPDCEILAIRCLPVEPKFLTVARHAPGGRRIVITHVAFCFQASLVVQSARAARRDEIAATLSFLYQRVDEPAVPTFRIYLDVGADAARAFDEEELQRRFDVYQRLSQ